MESARRSLADKGTNIDEVEKALARKYGMVKSVGGPGDEILVDYKDVSSPCGRKSYYRYRYQLYFYALRVVWRQAGYL